MPDLVTRGTKLSELDYQEGDEQISQNVREITSTPFTLTQAHNREHLICGAGSSVIRFTATATLEAALDTTFNAGDTIGWSVIISNNSGSAVTINDNSIQFNGGTDSLSLADNSSVIISFDHISATEGYFSVSDYDATLGTTLDGKMDLVATVNSPGNAVVIDAAGQAFDADVPLATVVFETLGPFALDTYTLSTVSHTLGAVPQYVGVQIICDDPGGDGGFSNGDRVFLNPSLSDKDEGATTQDAGVLIVPTSTNIQWRTLDPSGADSEHIAVVPKVGSATGAVLLDNTKWNIEFNLLAFTGVVAAP